MGEVSTIGLDIAKWVFQVHGVDADGAVVIRKRISRAKVLEFFAAVPPCLVGIEACPSAHHWSRELQALGMVKPRRAREWKIECSATSEFEAALGFLRQRVVGRPLVGPYARRSVESNAHKAKTPAPAAV
jgi:hypothetical protein